MNPVSWVFVIAGVIVIAIASLGLVKLGTTYARIHAAGKASPIAFLLVAIGVAPEVGWVGVGRLVLATAALLVTLPLAVHLLFRAVHVSQEDDDPDVDELRGRRRAQ